MPSPADDVTGLPGTLNSTPPTAASTMDPIDADATGWSLDELLDTSGSTWVPDSRPVLAVVNDSVVVPWTRPPTIVVRLRVQGQAERIYRLQRLRTAPAATLAVLIHFLRDLGDPTRVSLGVDDPTVARLLAGRSPTPPWLKGAADLLLTEFAACDHSVDIAHLHLDSVAPRGIGCG